MDKRLEALKEINRQDLKLSVAALEGVDQITARIAVWALYTEQWEEALILCEKRGLCLTEASLWELGRMWVVLWGVHDSLETRPCCFLCGAKRSVSADRLCKCFRAVQVGVHMPCTQERIDYLIKKFPVDWHVIPMETIICVRCHSPEPILAGRVASQLRRGKAWKEQRQKLCKNCFEQSIKIQSSRPPTANKMEPMDNSLKSLASQIGVYFGES